MSKSEEKKIFAESLPLDEDDEKLSQFFNDLEKDSLKTLEDAARQIITLVTTLLGLFFGVLAFKDNPTFLVLIEVKILGIVSAVSFLAALFLALDVVMPRSLPIPESNLTAMRQTLRRLFNRKRRSQLWSQVMFAAGVLSLLGIIIRLLVGC